MNFLIQAMNTCKYLYLHDLNDGDKEGFLKLEIHEAGTEEVLSTKEEIDALLGGSLNLPALHDVLLGGQPIQHHHGCKKYELIFKEYIGFAVENESYAVATTVESEVSTGVFRVHTSSPYLTYLKSVTWAHKEHLAYLKHYELLCLNHIVHVVSVNEPQVRIL